MASASPATVLRQLALHASGANLYAVLDGARDRGIHDLVTASDAEHACLYSGALHPALARAAPWLVLVDPAAPFARALVERGWGQSWGIFARSTLRLPALRAHLRRFLRVRDERGRALVFRYYDPRVLRAYLPTCTAAELDYVFGPVERYLAEGEDGGELLVFRRAPAGLGVERAGVGTSVDWLSRYARTGRVAPKDGGDGGDGGEGG